MIQRHRHLTYWAVNHCCQYLTAYEGMGYIAIQYKTTVLDKYTCSKCTIDKFFFSGTGNRRHHVAFHMV